MEDRMLKYKPKWTSYAKPFGWGALVLGAGFDNDAALTMFGAAALTSGFLADGIAYMKGYFNETLELLENQQKAKGLEQKVREE